MALDVPGVHGADGEQAPRAALANEVRVPQHAEVLGRRERGRARLYELYRSVVGAPEMLM
jgi:hypothetical protein